MELLHLTQNNDVFHCPFNNSHVMPHKTLSRHLSKCPDRPPNFKSCFFNNLHVMSEEDLNDHKKNCPDRGAVDNTLYESEDFVRPIPIFENVPSVVYNDESWDDDESSNMIKSIQNQPVLMKPTYGLTKSKRKEKRSETSRYSEVDLSYNKNMSIRDRVNATNKDLKTGPNQGKQTLFFGKRPN